MTRYLEHYMNIRQGQKVGKTPDLNGVASILNNEYLLLYFPGNIEVIKLENYFDSSGPYFYVEEFVVENVDYNHLLDIYSVDAYNVSTLAEHNPRYIGPNFSISQRFTNSPMSVTIDEVRNESNL